MVVKSKTNHFSRSDREKRRDDAREYERAEKERPRGAVKKRYLCVHTRVSGESSPRRRLHAARPRVRASSIQAAARSCT